MAASASAAVFPSGTGERSRSEKFCMGASVTVKLIIAGGEAKAGAGEIGGWG